MNSNKQEQLDMLCTEVEIAWQTSRDQSVVDRLAGSNPELASDIYDFFSLLLEIELLGSFEVAPRKTNVLPFAILKTQNQTSLLNQLIHLTGIKASQIADKLNIPYSFLIAIQRYSDCVPLPVREEIASRAANIFSINRDVALKALSLPYNEARAASRDKAYSQEPLSFSQLLKQTKLSKKDQQYWLSIANQNN